MEALLKYSGVDWAAVIFTFFGMWLIGLKHIMGPICMGIASIFWVVLGYMTQSFPMMGANSIFVVMNIWTIWRWTRKS